MSTLFPGSLPASAFFWGDALIRIGVIVLLTLILLRVVRLLARRADRRLQAAESDRQQMMRVHTLLQTGRSGIEALVIILAVFMILNALGINVVPLLAGASVAGLAISLGAQTLIKDYIAGILILLDDLYRVGDGVVVAGVSGSVERITLRSTYLRDESDGRLHVVPNGEIRVVANRTRGWARTVVEARLPLATDLRLALAALDAAAQAAFADETLRTTLLETPLVVGPVSVQDDTVLVRLTAKTLPGKQEQVAPALRRFTLAALQRAGIEVLPLVRPAAALRVQILPPEPAP
ncbi:MAG: mechanosensitive ion channel domain-containing protein [Anaerolineae bacterium]|uniref:mechanosensitive ion channel family protein n=1 Tax=Candidatus Amarolinea dominans TaxID=3140696 RepID=UPI003135D836|nr:mechanosensitive ion channel [Anaerolineae bacterium]MBK9095849.1 mechanosensitive ion channel [Anaerolineae bacterium]MBK9230034.1 mechanosensitive ion channel [Anaerolineae bacterium]